MRRAPIIKGILFTFFAFCCFTTLSCRKNLLEKIAPAGGSSQKLSSGASATISDYYLYLPKDYYSSGKKYPTIIFLHGNAQKGASSTDVLTQVGVPLRALQQGDFPFIVIAPLMKDWVINDLDKMYSEVSSMYRMDTDRIIVSGFSIGGTTAWSWASSYPDRFAALNAIGCTADANVCNLKKVPVWDFHNRYDLIFRLESIQPAIDQLIACGGNVKFTIYDDGGHEGWTKAYNDPALYEWFLAQNLKNRQ